MHCERYINGLCRSCDWIELPYSEQMTRKEQVLHSLLSPFAPHEYLPSISGVQSAFRNKAKMVVSGTVDKPVLGIINDENIPVDLTSCPLYPEGFPQVFATLTEFIRRAQLNPYHIAKRKGELKYLLLTQSQFDGALMLRFVLRSNFAVQSIRSRLAWLQTALPELRVISVNIQPVHMAVLEGEEEHILTQQQALYEQWNGVPLFIRPGSFFQTNAVVAAQLYSCARDWTQALPRKLIWDLFCGAGGFGLHCADEGSELIGIEVSTEAIKSAEMSAQQLGLRKVSFQALPALDFALQQMPVPDLVIVNPPRRGIGQEMCRYLSGLAPTHLLYSSCNAQTLALDLANLPCYELVRVQLFDMFPHTAHFETLVLLRRRVS